MSHAMQPRRHHLHAGLLAAAGSALLAWVLFDAGSLAAALGAAAAAHEAVVALIALLLVGSAWGLAIGCLVRSALAVRGEVNT